MKTISEEELIAYQLGELPWWKRILLRHRLQRDPALAAEADEIATTLDLFATDAAPAPSAEIAARSWERVRSAMVVLEPARTDARMSRKGFWIGASTGAIATAVLIAALGIHSLHVVSSPVTSADHRVASPATWAKTVIAELHTHKAAPAQFNNRPGPLTVAPPDAVAEDPALATHLDTAERLLTEVSHTEGALPQDTRAQVHRLLLQNAVYHQSAEQRGDHATAAVIDDLGRVLITLDAEPAHGEANPDAFRLQMNLGGVLLDLRILHHNDTPPRGE